MQKPHLLYVMQFYHNRGGVEEHVRDLAQGLAGDFNIRIVAPEEGKLVVIENEQTIRSYDVERDPWPMTPYKLPQLEAALATELKDFKPDVIHLQHFFNWHIGVVDQLTATGAPVIVTFHDYNVITPYYTMQGAPTPSVALSPEYCQLTFRTDISDYVNKRFKILSASLAKCRCFLCPSNFLVGQLSTVLPYPFQVIEHGIHPFTPAPIEPGAERRFAYIGSKLPQKGWMELLKAFQILQASVPKAELYFFGGGQKPPERPSPGVKFFGTYTRDELPKIMSHFSIGVIPSMFGETFSYVLSEQWAGGKPVAVSKIGTLGERVKDGVNGRHFLPGDMKSMVETLRWFLENDDWMNWTLPQPRLIDTMLDDYRRLYRTMLES